MRSIFLLTLIIPLLIQAQHVNQRAMLDYEQQKAAYEKGSETHTAFKSASSLEENWPIEITLKDSSRLSFRPNVDAFFGLADSDSLNAFMLGYGASMQYQRKKLDVGINYLHFQGRYIDYQQNFIANNDVVPGQSAAFNFDGDKYHSDYIDAHIQFKASKIFNFEVGYGRNFIGDGYRSLLLSDAANASPYVKITTKFWKFQYTNLFAAHQNIFGANGKRDLYLKKYTATHFLDWKATKWLSLGLFESIVWQADEPTYTRGFDPTYANPIIFYRPVEFSVGSSDNALVGANLKITVKKKQVFYSQIILDEFLLSEIRADINQWRNPDEDIRSGWWGNKYGIQIGHTTFDPFGIEGLQTRLEYNVVRPFTYAHSSPTQAYSNYNMSLAHPLGANFWEVVGILQYKRDNWLFRAQYTQSERGTSVPGLNFGENLQISNSSFRAKEYENEITQGLKSDIVYYDISATYVVNKVMNTYLTLGFLNRDGKFFNAETNDRMFYIQLRTLLYNRYFDF